MSDSTYQPQHNAPQQPGGYQGGPPPQYDGGQPGGHGGHGGRGRSARNGLGTAALVLGIIGALSGLLPILFWLAGLLGLLALVFGLVGRGRAKRGEATNKGVTTTGAVLGLLSLGLSIWGAVTVFNAVDDAVNEINKELGGSTATKVPGGDDAKDGESGKAKAQTLTGGDSAAYQKDGIKITVSKPTPAELNEFASGHTEGNKAYEVTVVIENTGQKKYDSNLVLVDARAGADGVAAEQIYDDGTYGTGFTSDILPGKKATAKYAFDAPAAAKTLQVEVNPGFLADASQWELKL
ncbi:DUF4352 domain-containing protein [Streptomyces sp. NPDC046887]|uniref:DUF4352 domain-containing protein n=1 Tax=Streptomyces sp. NPDC046887 TaxID=3155472 RepID=UPI0033C76737